MKKILTLILFVMFLQIPVIAETVVFNTQTLKIHSLNCPSAAKCTKSCIKIDRKEAIKRGGVSCKKCN